MKPIHSPHCSCQISYYTSRLYQTRFHGNFSIILFIQIIYLSLFVQIHKQIWFKSHYFSMKASFWKLLEKHFQVNFTKVKFQNENGETNKKLYCTKISNGIFVDHTFCCVFSWLNWKKKEQRENCIIIIKNKKLYIKMYWSFCIYLFRRLMTEKMIYIYILWQDNCVCVCIY